MPAAERDQHLESLDARPWEPPDEIPETANGYASEDIQNVAPATELPRGIFGDGIRSCLRTIALADRNRRPTVFSNMAGEAFKYGRSGGIDQSLISDKLQHSAESTGLVDDIGQDAVQKLLGAAACSAAPAETTQHNGRHFDNDDKSPVTEATALETFDASQWEGQPIEPREWLVHDRIPLGEPGIVSGDGGTGKTKLMLQLGVAIAAELPDWIGGVVETHGPILMLSAEEKLKEMHRRTADILDHRGLSFRHLKGRLHFICDPEEAILGKVGRNGIVQPTMSLLRLEKTIMALRPALIVIENAADVFGGNELDRTNVTRFVRVLLGGLTRPCNSTMALIQHPSLSGLTDGTGRSGSTGWNNSGRWRGNFTKIKSQDDEPDSGLRQYEVVKNNYGPIGEKIRVRWERGVFVPEGTPDGFRKAAQDHDADATFLRLLDERERMDLPVGPNTGHN